MPNLRTNTTANADDEEDYDYEGGGGVEVGVVDHGPNSNNSPLGLGDGGGGGGDADNSSSAFDDAVVRRAVSDAGQFAFGIVMVEVWLLSKDQTRLYRPRFGLWVDPVYASSSDETTQKNLARLTDPSRKDYVPTTTLAIGEGLAGMLYVEAKNLQGGGGVGAARSALNRMRGGGGGGGGLHRRSSEARIPRSASVRGPNVPGGGAGGAAEEGASPGSSAEASATASRATPANSSHVFFRNVNQISADPDQPFSPRLRMIAELGLGWCAAVPMFHGRSSGIVLFLARNHVSLHQLQSAANQNYLVAAARFVEAALDLREPRRIAEEARRKQVRDCWTRVHDRIVYLKRMGIPLADAIAKAELEKEKQKLPDLRQSLKLTVSTTRRLGEALSNRIVMMLKKSRGGGGMVPPAMSAFQSCYSFVGAFATLTILHFINLQVEESYDAGLALGPFGGLVTMMYSLSSAPASQPRNAVLGQLFSIAIGLGFSYATSIPVWLRVNLATSLAVAVMSKLAIIHPPAGAAAFAFASGALNWAAMLVFLVGYVITILIAMFVNNWSAERQYPIYWGVPGSDEGRKAAKKVQAKMQRGGKGKNAEGGPADPKNV